MESNNCYFKVLQADISAKVNPKDAPKDAAAAEDDDEVDLFGSDESEDEEAKKIKEENLAAYKKKKEGKVKPAAKSIVTLDVKPWGKCDSERLRKGNTDRTGNADDETDMKELESNMRSIEMDGLTWGASKLVAVGYGISKLQVNLVVEDEKVSIDDLQGKIESDEDHVQSTDVVSLLFSTMINYALTLTSSHRLLCKNCETVPKSF